MTKLATMVFTTQKQDKPEGVVVGGYSVSLMLAGVLVGEPRIVADASVPIVFPIQPGLGYTIEVVRVAETGEAVSPVASSAPFDVAQDQIDVPLTVTVMIGEVPLIDVPANVAVDVTA